MPTAVIHECPSPLESPHAPSGDRLRGAGFWFVPIHIEGAIWHMTHVQRERGGSLVILSSPTPRAAGGSFTIATFRRIGRTAALSRQLPSFLGNESFPKTGNSTAFRHLTGRASCGWSRPVAIPEWPGCCWLLEPAHAASRQNRGSTCQTAKAGWLRRHCCTKGFAGYSTVFKLRSQRGRGCVWKLSHAT